jgi:hypothetical protein
MKNPDAPPPAGSDSHVAACRLFGSVVLPLFVLFVVGFSFMVNEEIFKGIRAFTLHPINE